MKKLRQLLRFGKRFGKRLKEDRVRAHAAEAAFFTILSFFPVLMLFLHLIQFTPINQELVIYIMEEITPFEIEGVLRTTVEGYGISTSAMLSWTAVVALWAAGKGVMGLSDGLNAIYQIEQTKNYILVRIRSACCVIFTLLSLLLSIGILVLGYRIQFFLRQQLAIIETYNAPVLILSLVFTASVLVVLFTLMFVFLPFERMKFRTQIPGAIFTTLSWTVFSYAFSVYLDFAENLARMYGGLTILAVAMLWLYFCMYLFFVGAELNVYLAKPDYF